MIDEPMAAVRQYRNSPLSPCDVIRMLIGPTIGIEQTKPTARPIKEIVMRLESMASFNQESVQLRHVN